MLNLDLTHLLSRDASNFNNREKFVCNLRNWRNIAPEHVVERLENFRSEGSKLYEREDFLWMGIISAATTVQGVKSNEYMTRNSNVDARSFSSFLKANDRDAYTKNLIGAKSDSNEIGSLEKLKKMQISLKSLTTRDEKIDALKKSRLKGFGPKYARNFWMDFCDPEFVDGTFALDSRLQKFIAVVWPHFDSKEGKKLIGAAVGDENLYGKIEYAMNEIAKEAGVTSWDMDRLLFLLLENEEGLPAFLK